MSELLNLKDKILELHAKSEVQTMESVGQLDMLPSTEPQNVEQSEQASEQSKLIKQIEEMQFQLSSIQRQTETKRTNKEQQRNTNSSMLPRNTVQPQAFSSWPKEFKIAGQVGEPGQKDRLTFSSLARQIEHGLNKGFPELEIVDAVIRAIAPGMQLRSYLEGKANLTLPILHRILCSHYQERSATELYKQLTSEVQGIKETPQAFLIRALDLRQKILFALQESESGLKYDPGHTKVQKKKGRKRAPLIGTKYLVDCYMQGQMVRALWDSGSQVTIMDEQWKAAQLPDVRLRALSEILDAEDTLNVVAANGESMPYTGWIEVTFRLAPETAHTPEVIVPALVMKGGTLSQPIIGSNVIALIVGSQMKQASLTNKEQIAQSVRAAFPDLHASSAQALVEQVSAEQIIEYDVRTTKEVVRVPKCTSLQVECRIQTRPLQEDTTLLFEPTAKSEWPDGLEFSETLVKLGKNKKPFITVNVQNPTDHDIMLAGRMIIGTVQSVHAVYPAAVLEGCRPALKVAVSQAGAGEDQAAGDVWDPPVDVNHLDEPEKEIGWVKKSNSPYVSPVVCVRKKDGTLRLCIDYQELNKKTIPDRQPIPRVQDIMDGLGGNSWFSLLDQGKAYHQGFMTKGSQPMTDFVTPWGPLNGSGFLSG
ncbi:hypothetical protein SRHO_G00006800 [Serrasalmus rhombeus]